MREPFAQKAKEKYPFRLSISLRLAENFHFNAKFFSSRGECDNDVNLVLGFAVKVIESEVDLF
jgi:hypothetical protein